MPTRERFDFNLLQGIASHPKKVDFRQLRKVLIVKVIQKILHIATQLRLPV